MKSSNWITATIAAIATILPGCDSSVLQDIKPGVTNAVEVRVLSPLDLAVSKLARFSDQDRSDVETLAKAGLIDAASLRRRATEALGGYVGDLESVRMSIGVACRLLEAAKDRRKARDS